MHGTAFALDIGCFLFMDFTVYCTLNNKCRLETSALSVKLALTRNKRLLYYS